MSITLFVTPSASLAVVLEDVEESDDVNEENGTYPQILLSRPQNHQGKGDE